MRFLLLAVVAVMTASASAASYFFNNGSGSTASGITDSLGGTFQNGTTPGAAFATGGGISAGPGVVGVGQWNQSSWGSLESVDYQCLKFEAFHYFSDES